MASKFRMCWNGSILGKQQHRDFGENMVVSCSIHGNTSCHWCSPVPKQDRSLEHPKGERTNHER